MRALPLSSAVERPPPRKNAHRRERLGAGVLEGRRGRVGAREREDRVAVTEQLGDDGGADQATATGDEDVHAAQASWGFWRSSGASPSGCRPLTTPTVDWHHTRWRPLKSYGQRAFR